MTGGTSIDARRQASAPVASARRALRRLPTARALGWLVRSGALETATALSLVLLDALPNLVDALGAGGLCHG